MNGNTLRAGYRGVFERHLTPLQNTGSQRESKVKDCQKKTFYLHKLQCQNTSRESASSAAISATGFTGEVGLKQYAETFTF
jgi:hypothetical protein